tara:strand:+ start:495 stop:1280 length:786 start_codon:yes stop_codon:yes gene_type:complete
MTWSEFKSAVRTYLTVDGARLNVQDYIDRAILTGVIEVQSYIPYYRIHKTVIFSQNGTIKDSEPVTNDNLGSSGILEGDVRITDAYFVDGTADYDWPDDQNQPNDENCECYRVPLTQWPWANRNDLLCGYAKDHHAIAIHPNGVNFIVYPQVTSTDKLEVHYQSIDRAFTNTDTVPFSDEEVIMAVAEYVKAKLAREVDRDLPLHNSYITSYMAMRRNIYIDTRDRKRVLWTTASPLSEAAMQQPNKACEASETTTTSNCS